MQRLSVIGGQIQLCPLFVDASLALTVMFTVGQILLDVSADGALALIVKPIIVSSFSLSPFLLGLVLLMTGQIPRRLFVRATPAGLTITAPITCLFEESRQFRAPYRSAHRFDRRAFSLPREGPRSEASLN